MNKNNIIKFLRSKKDSFKRQHGISTLGLYGSYARDEATANSDVDIFYTTDDRFSMGLLEWAEFLENLKKELDIDKLDFVNLNSMNPIIKYYAKKDFIYV